MTKTILTFKKAKKTTPRKAAPGRVFTISMKGIPSVNAETKARLEAAARNPNSKRRNYPLVTVD